MKSTLSDDLVKLSDLPVGSRATIKRVQGGRHLVHRLLSLGLRAGSEIELLQRRGSGVVVACQGNRVALGSGVAEKLLLSPFDKTV
ncbi:MAG: ferrous iron transport protein A [Candidatus Thiodiazotropha sp. (ex. Lucinisca nassula)]|nr:ferrous iron transport protein A [Candidatus Thiodiazotropha sp. (ex. Lucinisca nassula)]MBW9261209.1 ferrous iron transport protein A [Candidatus Thiodiazotropha sp. (ex. Lucinisca nassula)]MBW9268958.1 ferrous iron transport protein A [Candidatus Thiodiazotropha sp. (ex. Lucinisca nassula)]